MCVSIWHCSYVWVYVCSVAIQVRLFCDPVDCHLPGSSVHGIFLARILEWVAMFSSREFSRPKVKPAFPVSPALQVDSLLLSH